MKISTAELRASFELVLSHLEKNGHAEVELHDDFYWDVPADARYSPYEKPVELTIGQLSDDWIELQKMLGGSGTVAYGFVWLAALLRRVGEVVVD